MAKIIGIDASTSATGIVVLDNDDVVFYGALTFKGCKTFWEKCDAFAEYAKTISSEHPVIDDFYIEEPMKRFSNGFSSAETISTLQRFNGIVCYLTRQIFNIEPVYVSVSTARKAAGVKVLSKANSGGKNAKQQTFECMMETDLKHISWPKKKRSDNIVDWAKDVVDAYVVAKGGAMIHRCEK